MHFCCCFDIITGELILGNLHRFSDSLGEPSLINIEFDSSYKRNRSAKLAPDRVIKGWQQALPMRKTGTLWQFYLPAELAHGAAGLGIIGSNETLIFEVELIEVH